MHRILLISDNEDVFRITQEVTQEKYKLIWCKYNYEENKKYPDADIVIMYFDINMLKQEISETVIKAKARMRYSMPILALIEKGTPQDIFLILEAGAYDYMEITDSKQNYEKKIEELILWDWYLKKYIYK
ncbi:MAG: hypothetical protein K1W16_06690 [Lachnospiraceae bacterium]|jgi:Response regulators consisting of a CheY-like receiver domain and a winged-helix DNA-binding domain